MKCQILFSGKISLAGWVKSSAADILNICFYFSKKIGFATSCLGDNLHEMSKRLCVKNKKTISICRPLNLPREHRRFFFFVVVVFKKKALVCCASMRVLYLVIFSTW